MLEVNHCDIKRSFEMQSTNDSEAGDHRKFVQDMKNNMHRTLTEGKTVTITAQDPEDVRSNQSSAAIITLESLSDLDIYLDLLGARPEALADLFYQWKVSQAMADANTNADG